MSEQPAEARLKIDFAADNQRVRKLLTLGDKTVEVSRAIRRQSEDLAADWDRGYLQGEPIVPSVRPVQRINTAELFCGSGGLGLGVREACHELGFRYSSLACLDHDPEAVNVYAANHGSPLKSTCSATEIVDYTVVGQGETARFLYPPELIDEGWQELTGDIDVLMAGPPCQGHSNLNNRSRRIDKRNQLYLTVPAIATALGARAVVIENVQAVIHDRSEVIGTTIALLQEAGYQVETGVVSAVNSGWPQTRKRFFLIARRPGAPLDLTEVGKAVRREPRSLGWAIGDLENLSTTDALHQSVDLSDENRRRIDFLFDNDLHDLPNSERPACHQDGTTYRAVYGRMKLDAPAPTITTGFLTPGRGRYIHPTQRRTLTPREAARIQGFPDTYTFTVNPKHPVSKAKLTKWIGDAVPMPLGYFAGLSALAPLLGMDPEDVR